MIVSELPDDERLNPNRNFVSVAMNLRETTELFRALNALPDPPPNGEDFPLRLKALIGVILAARVGVRP